MGNFIGLEILEMAVWMITQQPIITALVLLSICLVVGAINTKRREMTY